MSNFASSANYGHSSSEAQQGNPPAHTVGTEFSRQFYFVLTQQPSLAHRFYTDGSSLTHSTGATGITVYGQSAINEKIVSLNLDGASAEVENVDAQYSLAGGVTVLVTGHLTIPGKERKAFVQSFFLATQERGYFVLNDTFRYLAEPAKAFAADFATPDVVTHGASQQYGAHHEANGYSTLGARPASTGLSAQPQHTQAPSAPQASAFQQGNGHFHAPQATAELSSGFSSGHSSGDLAQIPSPPPSQGLPPPPPKPSAPSVAPTPTPAQQTPTAPTQEPSDEQEPEQSSSQQQQQQPPAAQEKGPANDQLVPQPAVDQNRPPVKPQQRRPSAPAASQETDKKASGQQAAASSTPPTQRSYADLLRSAQAASAPSAPQSSSAAATTPAQPTSPAAPTPAPRPSGNRSQNKSAQAAAPAASASSDTSGKGEQAGGSLPALDKPAVRPAGSDGPPARPPYSAPGRGVQGYRDDDSSKKAVYVRNIPQDATSEEIRELFSQFGSVRPGNGSITLKHNGGNNSFAYVDFMDVASAQACVDAKDVMLKDNTLNITPKRANYGGGRGGGRFGGRGDGRGPGGFGRGRGGDRGGFQGRGGSGSFPDDAQLTGGDRPQGARPQNSSGQGAPRGRGGRDGNRGRGRGGSGSRPQSSSQTPEVAPPAE